MKYAVTFLRPAGCPGDIVRDMARFDRAKVLSTSIDPKCEPGSLRVVLLEGDPPTRERWASFLVGAQFVEILEDPDTPIFRWLVSERKAVCELLGSCKDTYLAAGYYAELTRIDKTMQFLRDNP